jgi:hypothetical protein
MSVRGSNGWRPMVKRKPDRHSDTSHAQGFLVCTQSGEVLRRVQGGSKFARGGRMAVGSQCQIAVEPAAAWLQIETGRRHGACDSAGMAGAPLPGRVWGRDQRTLPAPATGSGGRRARGDPRHKHCWRICLTAGRAGPYDAARALRLYKLAAEQGDADAQNNLGEIYETGRGVEKSLPEALQWYERAGRAWSWHRPVQCRPIVGRSA